MARTPWHAKRNSRTLAKRNLLRAEARDFKIPALVANERRVQRRSAERELRIVRARQLAEAKAMTLC